MNRSLTTPLYQWHPLTYLIGEYILIVDHVRGPRHQVVDVFRRGALDRLLYLLPVCPMILVPDGVDSN